MRYKQLGDDFSVTVSAKEIHIFADNWPGSGMHDAVQSLCFVFDANGDLKEIYGERLGYNDNAVGALMADAQKYGRRKRE